MPGLASAGAPGAPIEVIPKPSAPIEVIATPSAPIEVIPKPKGDIANKGNITTAADYADVTGTLYTVTKDKKFQLAKIVLACKEDSMARIMFGATQIGVEYYVMGKTTLTDWFPHNYRLDELVGDGSKQIRIQAKYVTIAGDFQAELVGEEV
jgi:hypothetical protein